MLNQVLTPKNMKRILLSESEICTIINPSVTPKQQLHYWYGGEMATIEAGGFKFHIDALGDMRARLYDHPYKAEPNHEDCLEDEKDSSNSGHVGSVLESYIQTDEELYQLINDEHPKYQLVLTDGNWWECSITDPDGDWHDLLWNLDSSYLNEAIEEVLTSLKDGFEIDDTILQLKA